ncbi:ArsR/SmtB family transcription factor [Spirosoma flavum]|uniref:ArsR/SmtB family transcription factor n=1 Tax=Spirosoma flavum TaxID=2048557 RepID=A0ABW6AGR7_9BACT
MNQVDVFKALSNKTRLQILSWLKEPEIHFPLQDFCEAKGVGVCVGHIQAKCGLNQSTVSEYLSLLQRAGLVTATRVGQWTFYKRNEDGFTTLTQIIQHEI